VSYSFVKGRPIDPVGEPAVVVTTLATEPTSGSLGTVATPMVAAEADLYAVDEERVVDQVMAHAEWLAMEYFSYDGSETSRQTLATLLPQGVPLPEAPEGTQVFVDWVGAGAVSEISPLVYQVAVTVRSLVSGSDGGFVRQTPIRALMEVMIGADGRAIATRPPAIETGQSTPTPHVMALTPVPDGIRAQAEADHGALVGGEQLPDGGWRVVVMVTDPDGVTRPRTVTIR
jgi:hypothetical protein